ncbi:MAG: hypothetical protein ACYDEX_21505 [Mobilitalea sp.]
MGNVLVNELLSDLGIIKKEFISKENITEENKENVFKSSDGFHYTYDNDGLTEDDIKLIIMAKQAMDVKKIKNMVIFFVVITCISLVLSLFGWKL